MSRKNKNTVQEDIEVSDVETVETISLGGYDSDGQPVGDVESSTEKSNDQNKPKREKAPVPEGHETPVQFAKRLSEIKGKEVRPQIIYGYIRNSSKFPFTKNTDGAFLVNVEEALAWFDEKEVKAQERAAKKAEKEAAKAEAPAESE